MKFTRRPDLDPQTRIDIVQHIWINHGIYGKMTRIAHEYHISRTFLYQLSWAARRHLEDLFRDPQHLVKRIGIPNAILRRPLRSATLEKPPGHPSPPCRRQLLARGTGGVPSTLGRPAAAARSKVWSGFAGSGHTAQDAVRLGLRRFFAPGPREGPSGEGRGQMNTAT
jgi:hypothetical protein